VLRHLWSRHFNWPLHQPADAALDQLRSKRLAQLQRYLLLLVRGHLGCLGQHSLLGDGRALRYRLDINGRALSDERISRVRSRWCGFRSMSSGVRSTVSKRFDVELMWIEVCEIESDTERVKYHRVTTQSLCYSWESGPHHGANRSDGHGIVKSRDQLIVCDRHHDANFGLGLA
jgi:hypothetical protein